VPLLLVTDFTSLSLSKADEKRKAEELAKAKK
jgi:hypothetical protein